QLGVDAGHDGGAGLVVIVDELDRAAEQPAARVDLLGPDLLGQQVRLAGRGEAAGERHAEADLDRLLRAGRVECSGQHAQDEHDSRAQATSNGLLGHHEPSPLPDDRRLGTNDNRTRGGSALRTPGVERPSFFDAGTAAPALIESRKNRRSTVRMARNEASLQGTINLQRGVRSRRSTTALLAAIHAWLISFIADLKNKAPGKPCGRGRKFPSYHFSRSTPVRF